MTQQPEALRLAERLAEVAKYSGSEYWDDLDEAAAELRRLNAVEVESNLLIEGEWQRNKALADRITTLEAALKKAVEALDDTAYRLEQSRIWGGLEWEYLPIRPFKYLPVRDKARDAATAAEQALKGKA